MDKKNNDKKEKTKKMSGKTPQTVRPPHFSKQGGEGQNPSSSSGKTPPPQASFVDPTLVKSHKEGKEKGEGHTSSSTSRQNPREKKSESLPPLPALGQPGGRDDPLRRGLSGAGCKWYLRYLAQGIPPEEARKKAEEHKKGNTPTSVKRKRDETTPTQKPLKRRKETPGVAGSYAAAAKLERIAILPRAFPENILSKDDQTAVEEALVEEMCFGWEHKIQFRGIHFQPGYILVDCETPQSAEWLRVKVPQLKGWKGVELMTCKGDDIPKAHTITIFLPRSQGLNAEKLLKLIEAQNEKLRISDWKILSLKDTEKGHILRAGIDDLSCQTIKNNGHTIHYRFGKIPVQGLKEKEEKKEPTPSSSKEKQEEGTVSLAHLHISDPHGEEVITSMEVEGSMGKVEEGDITLQDEDRTLTID